MSFTFNLSMKSKDIQKVVLRVADDGMSSLQIDKQLRKVVSELIVERWQHLYRSTGIIDLRKPQGKSRTLRTKSQR